MSEHPIPEVITPDQDAIWRKRLDGATDYSIKLQRLIESLKREDTPYPELHHHKMAIAVKERIAYLSSENTQLRDALTNMIVICGKPMREEWLNEEAFADATKIVEEACAALAEKGLI